MQEKSFLSKIIAPLHAFNSKAANVSLALAAMSTGLICVVITLEVLSRIILNQSFSSSIEIGELAMVLMTFTIMPYVQVKQGQINVDIILGRLSPEKQNLFNLFHRIVSFFLYTFLAIMMIRAVPERFHGGDVTFDLLLPIWIFMAIAGVFMAFLALTMFEEMLSAIDTAIENKVYAGLIVVLILVALVVVGPFLIKGAAFMPSKLAMGALGFGALLLLLLIGMPIGTAMGLIGCVGIVLVHNRYVAALSLVGTSPYTTASQFVLTVMPMFILMGEICAKANISQDLFRTANLWFGHHRGGLGIASISGCAGFAAVCGESMATAVTMGVVAMPEMKAHKYDTGFACATLAAGGTLGILIPPSSGFIWYAIIVEQSVGKLFMAGIIPGILLATLFCLVAVGTSIVRPDLAPRGSKYPFNVKIAALAKIIPMVLLIVLVLGGILGGFFNPTEGGAIGAMGALLYSIANRTMTMKKLIEALVSTTIITGRILFILIGVYILSYFMAATQLPQGLAAWINALGLSKYMVLGLICLIYIFLGMLINVVPMMLLTLPALFPTVMALGFDPIWFGVVVVLLMEMGLITPPVGLNVFAMKSAVPEVSLSQIYYKIIPYFLMMVLCIILLTVFPELALWLPEQVFN